MLWVSDAVDDRSSSKPDGAGDSADSADSGDSGDIEDADHIASQKKNGNIAHSEVKATPSAL